MDWESRTYQQEAIAECVEAFSSGKSSVMLESPVGAGKTFMGLEIVRLLEERLGRQLRVAWVAPRHRLLEQVMEANRDLHQLLVRPVSLFEKTPPTADIVVLDEAHHEATQSCVLLYEKIKAPLTLGLSATPIRTDRMKLSFQLTVATCGIGRLIREGYLCPIHSYLLPHWGPRVAAECYLSDPRRWGKSLVFFQTISDCLVYRDELAAGGIRCEVVTGESDKDAQLARFASGEVPVIANVSILTEGFDQPDVATVFARDASRVPTIQMCGRGLRLFEDKDHCNIVQSSGTPFLFERVTPPLRSFRLHNGQWLALQDKTAEIEEALRRSIRLLEERETLLKKPRLRRPRMAGQTQGRRPPPPPVEIEPEVKRAYQGFYWLYELCNRFAWNGTLPPCLLSFNCSTKPTHVAGFAQPRQPYPRLSLNLLICARAETCSFLPILLHEMTHIWQFARGSRGGHGRDFRRELLRVGIDETGQTPVEGSPAESIMATAQVTHPEIAGIWRTLVGHPPARQRVLEDAIFREYLSAKGLA